MFFKIIVEYFSAPVASSLSFECNVFETDKKTLLSLLLAEGRVSNASLHDMLCSIDARICVKLRHDFSSLPNTKSRYVSAVALCSFCILSGVKQGYLSALLCEALRHLGCSCVEVFIVQNSFYNKFSK